MTVEDCYQLGYVIKPHGLRGEVQIYLDVDDPQAYTELESVFVQKGQGLVPFFIASMAVRGEKAIVAFEGTETLEQAQELKGLSLFLPLSTLPPLAGDRFYYHEIIDFLLIDESLGEVGVIKDVFDGGNQMLLSVIHSSSKKEILIPLQDELIRSVDREEKAIRMKLPEGLIDIYLNE